MSYPDLSLTPRETLDEEDVTASAEFGSDGQPLVTTPLLETPAGGVPRLLREWARYEVLELLGAGGMGAVYKARDPQLQRMLALKIIHPRLGMAGTQAMASLERRLLREARLQAALEHPHICKIAARRIRSDARGAVEDALIRSLIP